MDEEDRRVLGLAHANAEDVEGPECGILRECGLPGEIGSRLAPFEGRIRRVLHLRIVFLAGGRVRWVVVLEGFDNDAAPVTHDDCFLAYKSGVFEGRRSGIRRRQRPPLMACARFECMGPPVPTRTTVISSSRSNSVAASFRACCPARTLVSTEFVTQPESARTPPAKAAMHAVVSDRCCAVRVIALSNSTFRSVRGVRRR